MSALSLTEEYLSAVREGKGDIAAGLLLLIDLQDKAKEREDKEKEKEKERMFELEKLRIAQRVPYAGKYICTL